MSKKKKKNKSFKKIKSLVKGYAGNTLATYDIEKDFSYLRNLYENKIISFLNDYREPLIQEELKEGKINNILLLISLKDKNNFLGSLKKIDEYAKKIKEVKDEETYYESFLDEYVEFTKNNIKKELMDFILEKVGEQEIAKFIHTKKGKLREGISDRIINPILEQFDIRKKMLNLIRDHKLEIAKIKISGKRKGESMMFFRIRGTIHRIEESIDGFLERNKKYQKELSEYEKAKKHMAYCLASEIVICLKNKKEELEKTKTFEEIDKLNLNLKLVKDCVEINKELVFFLEKKAYKLINDELKGKYNEIMPLIPELYKPIKFSKIIRELSEKTCYQLVSEFNLEKYKEKIKTTFGEIEAIKKEREKQRNFWIRKIIGDSVFETYKTNNPEKIIIHTGETNTGKTYNALKALKNASKGSYLAPLRLLALEVYEELSEEAIRCSYITGEERKVSANATHVSSTIEKANYQEEYDCVVVDEAQMIGDKHRGSSWAKAILGIQTKELHIVVAPEGLEIIKEIVKDKNVEIRHYKREKELKFIEKNKKFEEVTDKEALVVFSKKKVLEIANKMEKIGKKSAIIYGAMPPSVRRKQIEAFKNGEYDIVVTTDAIGMGLNLPIQRVFFLENRKFDGEEKRYLTTNELKQIAGRAGRRGYFEEGEVSFLRESSKMIKLANKKTEKIEKIVIKPNYEMVESFCEELQTENALEALELFYLNWEKYKPVEEFVEVQETKQVMKRIDLLKKNKIEALSIEELWFFLNMPLREKLNYINDLWIYNIKCYLKEEMPRPLKIEKDGDLESLEIIYNKIELQMQFTHEEDPDYLYYEKEKEEISDKIFNLLKMKYGKNKEKKKESKFNKCVVCGEELEDSCKEHYCKECLEK